MRRFTNLAGDLFFDAMAFAVVIVIVLAAAYSGVRVIEMVLR